MEQVTTVKQHPRSTRIVWYIFYFIQIILLFRLFLKLIGASTAAPFTQFMYNLSLPFARPFLNIVSSWSFPPGILDWNILIAMLVYWIVAKIIIELIVAAIPSHTTVTVHTEYDKKPL